MTEIASDEPIGATLGTGMRVLHIITGLNDGGAEAVLYRLVVRDRADTHLVVSLMSNGKYGPLLQQAGAQVVALGMPRGRVSIRGLRELWRELRSWKPSVIQTWMYHANLLGGLAGRLVGVPVVWGIHNTTLQRSHSPRATIWISHACAHLSRIVPARVACCAERAKEVHVALGYDAGRMEVIPNGYDLSRFAPNAGERAKLRAAWRIPDSCPLIGMVARFDAQKDHKNLIKALGHLQSVGTIFEVVLIGTGIVTDNAELERWIAEAGIRPRVRLLGPRADIPAVMSALDVHVLSSSYGEAFPNVLAEAMACGTPCVTTDVGDAGRIVGDTGWVVPPEDANALARALGCALQALTQRETWCARQAQARRRIVDEFGIDKMVARYRAVWAQAMTGRATRSAD